MKSYDVKQEFNGSIDAVYEACREMLIASIKYIDSKQKINKKNLNGFTMKTAKGDFIVTKCSLEEGISYEIKDASKADVTNIDWEVIDEKRTLLFYSEYGSSNNATTRFMFWLKMTFDKKSFDIKAKSVLGSVKYYLENKGE